MEKRIRGWPNWKTSSTAVCATSEPKATMPAAQFWLTTRMATESGSAVLSSCQGIMPVSTTATTT